MEEAVIELDDEMILKLQIAINDASRQALDEFIHRHMHSYEDVDSVRSPGWYVASCHYWALGEEECSWETSGGESVVEDSVNQHAFSHDPVGVRVGRFHREMLTLFQEINANPRRLVDAHLHLLFHNMRELVCRMAEIGYGLHS